MNLKRSNKARVLLFFASLMLGLFVSMGLFHEKLTSSSNQNEVVPSDQRTALLTTDDQDEKADILFWNPQAK